MSDNRDINPFANIGKHLKEIEVNELESFVEEILKKEVFLSIYELKRILNEELNIQVLSNEEINELIAPIKKFITN